MFKIILFILMIISALFLRLKYKAVWSGVLSIIGYSIVGYFIFTDDVYIIFFITFAILVLVKLIRRLKTGVTDAGKYNASNFIYSGLIPLILGIIVGIINKYNVDKNIIDYLTLIIFCNLSTLLIDTASGELGQSFKTKTYLITTLKEVKSGTDGAISLSGTVLGLITGIIYVLICDYFMNIEGTIIILIIIVSFAGNLIDSLIGATLQRKR
jgi:uncharacterized protein (TIGR00297 family)